MFLVFIQKNSEGENYFLKTNRNFFFFLLFLFFFVCFGEEISWGQRLLGITTPECLQEINSQDEINIHNLWMFQSYDKDLHDKTGLKHWITSARLLAVFWALYCVAIPILNYISLGINRIIKKYNFPVIPLWISSLFVLTYIISSIFQKILHFTDLQPCAEVKETCFAFLFLIASLSLFFNYKKQLLKLIIINSDPLKTYSAIE